MIENPPQVNIEFKKILQVLHDSFETPFTPAVSIFYAYQEALNIIIEEGMQNRISRHRKCANAFYSGLEALGFTPFDDADSRSNVS